MKSAELSYAALAIILLAVSDSVGANSGKVPPEFEFDVWASPPSQKVYALSSEPVVQRILYSIEEKALSAEAIALQTDIPQGQILGKLNELSECGLGSV